MLALVSNNPYEAVRDALFLDLKNQWIEDLKTSFHEERQRHQQVYEQTETIFQKELSHFRDQLPRYLEKSKTVKEQYPDFTDNEYNSKPMFLLEPEQEYPFEATLNNGSQMIHTNDSIIVNERFVLLAYHMYPFLLATRNSSKLDRDFQEDLLRQLSRVREFLEEGFGQFGIVSQIAYNPFRLFEIFLTDCGPTDMFLNRMSTKTFWFRYEDDRGNPWISMGKIQGHTLVEFMKSSLESNETLKNRYLYANISFATVLGSGEESDYWEQAHLARQFHVEDKPWTAQLIEGRLYVQEVLPSNELRGYHLSIRMDATERFLQNRQIRNQ